MKIPGTLTVATPTDREVVMTRVFDAPRRLVFEALTNPDLLRRWFNGPPGWTLVFCAFDAQVGGKYRYVWRNQEGVEMGMGGVNLEIVAPERIVATEKFDQSWYPGEAVGTLSLTERDGKTTLTQTVVYESREARDAVLRTPMEKGVEIAYNSLAELLATLQ
jgi:uncharacterized protein YndB with AHSA1/START domain